ncbi:FAD-binding oxidoreductase [Kitasatospora mediocidica]|uniref:FAD-binding oxidoreductase n=1 Tax=Kitasatospora mediocidica TaxID=58352 RepID=UPI00055E99C7|nr:FAD-binding oxidoreductase [Kitasatospora mediocidica]
MGTVLRAAATNRLLQGWGRTTGSHSQVLGPLEPDRLRELIAERPERGVLARGAGCSYGDAAQNAGGLVLTPVVPARIDLDVAAARVRVSGSTTFAELLERVVPHGLLPPVLPGTRRLTVGGAVAADVHGKNQRADGSLFHWLESIELLCGDGELRTLTADRDGPAFRATVGGMGLTGVILAVTLRLIRIRSSLLRVTVRRAPDLDALMAELEGATSRYAVAWIDTTATGRSLGRGIVDLGDHLAAPDPGAEPDGLRYGPARPRSAPRMPLGVFNPVTARAFNELWYRRAPRERHALQGFPEFFHRLDAVDRWNLALGPRGFLQYQFAVPLRARHVVTDVLESLQRVGAAPFLGTLKRFGPSRGGPLSFPLPGWSLAVDMPPGGPRLAELLHGLDRKVANAGGRVYLAKDARLGRGAFDAMYGPLDDWRAARALLDPADTMRSDLGRRLGLCR